MERINFNQTRDLGQVLQDSSSFIRQNFLKIVKPVVIVGIIPMVLGAFLIATSFNSIFEMADNPTTNPTDAVTNMFNMFPGYFLIMLGTILAHITIIGYIKLYTLGFQDIKLRDIAPILKSKTFPLVFSSLLLVAIISIGSMLCLIPGIYFMIVFAQFFAISIIEDKSFSDAWSRCFSIIKDNWWPTFGLYFITYLIATAMYVIVYIPTYAILLANLVTDSRTTDALETYESLSATMAIISPFYYIVGLLIAILFSVVSSFQYFSLTEKLDGSGERELINQI